MRLHAGSSFKSHRRNGRWECLEAATAVAVPETIRGVIVAEETLAGFYESAPRGRFDLDGLKSIVECMKRNDTRTGGTKVGFNHDSAAGFYLGRITKPRLSTTTLPDGKVVRCVRGDLEFSELAVSGPFGNLAGYVSDLVAVDSRALMLSLVVTPKQIPADDGGPPWWQAVQIAGCDVVGAGAATSSMLSAFIPTPKTLVRGMKLTAMRLSAS